MHAVHPPRRANVAMSLALTVAQLALGGVLDGPERHAAQFSGMPCSGAPFIIPFRSPNGTALGGPARCNPRHPPAGPDGPIIGNGDVGAMLGGSGAGNISLWLTKNDLWNLASWEPECRYGTFNYTLYVPRMEIETQCGTGRSLDRNSQGMTGGISIASLGDGISDEHWHAVQHMVNGTVAGEFTTLSGARILTDSFVVAPHSPLTSKFSFVVTRMQTSAQVPLQITVGTHAGNIAARPVTGAGGGSGTGGTSANETWGSWVTSVTRSPPGGMRNGSNITLCIATRLVLGDGAGSSIAPGNTTFWLAATQPVWVVSALLSNIDHGERDPVPAAATTLQQLTASSIATMLRQHVLWWETYWSRSSVSLPTRQQYVERMWYSSQYVLGSGTRFGGDAKKVAPALNGAWVFGGEHNAFTLDYNAEAPYYGVASSNRAELIIPYATVVLDFMTNARIESAFFQCPSGLHYPGAIGPFGYYNCNWMHMHLHGSFSALPLIWHWEYTQNHSFLVDATIATHDRSATPYALFKGLAEWWACHLTKEYTKSGYIYSDLDDCSQEDLNYYNRPYRFQQRDNVCNATAFVDTFNITLINSTIPAASNSAVLRNPQISLSFARKVLRAAAETAVVLGLDSERRPVWDDLAKHLAPFPRGSIRDPCEFQTGVMHNHGNSYPSRCLGANSSCRNITVLMEMEHPKVLVNEGPPSGGNPIGFQGIFPGEGIGMDSARTEREIARQTVETVGMLGAWGQSNSFPESFNAAVRAGLDGLEILGNLTTVVNSTIAAGLMSNSKEPGIECAGVAQAINDMLCSSYGGYIHLFERWPSDEDASFTTLRAKGGFLVSADLRSGVVTDVTIVSEAGRAISLFSPWGSAISVIDAATRQPVDGLQVGAVEGTFTWPTTKGTEYTISKKTMASTN